MIEYQPRLDESDDADFMQIVVGLVTGAIEVHRPEKASIFKIDNWFDHKWLGFSGKVLGALGLWKKHLTVPPFVANRIIEQWQFKYDGGAGGYRIEGGIESIHHKGPSIGNLYRRVAEICPETALFWFSGQSKTTGRGSLMGYVPVDDGHWTWFVGLRREPSWRVVQRNNIHDYEIRRFGELSLCADRSKQAVESQGF